MSESASWGEIVWGATQWAGDQYSPAVEWSVVTVKSLVNFWTTDDLTVFWIAKPA